MTRPPKLPEKLAAAWPPAGWQNVTVIAAVSGGADSVALARALHSLRAGGQGRLILAHYNHRLRGDASDADEDFVRDLAASLGCPCDVGASPASDDRDSAGVSEASLRDERYAFLTQAAARSGARFVAAAHTADDQVETVLFNIMRGTGLAGVGGIRTFRRLSESATLVRPLLEVTRAEVLAFLSELGQDYREDATNRELLFTRNRIRHELLPLLERDYAPHIRPALLRLSRTAQEADAWVETQAGALLEQVRRPLSGGLELQIEPLRQAPPIIARAALVQAWRSLGWPLKDMSFDKWEQLLAFATAGDAAGEFERAASTIDRREMYPGGVVAERNRALLRVMRS